MAKVFHAEANSELLQEGMVPMCNEWKPIKTAPQTGSPRIDLWAKWWNPKTDKFEYDRVPDCYWGVSTQTWVGLDSEWRATHWMEIPKGPDDEQR